nr:hypothetical protein [Aquihabitans sp. G128]
MGLLVAVPVVVLLPHLFGGPIAPADAWVQDLPGKLIGAEALRSGRLPAWTGVEFGGMPLFAVAHFGIAYPLNLLLVALPNALGYNLGLVASLAISAVGCYLLADRILRDRAAAALVGLAVGLGPYRWSELSHPAMLSSVAWLPWAVLGVEIAQAPGRRFRGVVLVALATALAVLAGHQQMVVATGLAAGGWAVVRACSSTVQRWRPLLHAALGLAAGAGLSAFQLLPSLALLSSTSRGSYSYDEATGLSLSGSQLVYTLFPFASGGGHLSGTLPLQVAGASFPYLGAAVLVLAVGAVPSWRRERWILPAIVVSGIVVVAALSPLVPPLGHVVHQLPPFSRFRLWNRYWLVPELLAALLAGHTLRTLRRGTAAERAAIRRWCGAATAAYALAAGAVLGGLQVEHRSATGLVLPVALAVATFAGVAAMGGRWTRLAGSAVVAVVALDLVVLTGLSTPIVRVPSSELATARDAGTARDLVAPSPGGTTRYLAIGSYDDEPDRFFPRAPLTGLSGARSANGYDSLAPQRYLDALGMDFYGQVSARSCLLAPANAGVLDLLRVSTITARRGSPAARRLAALGPLAPVGDTGWVRVDRRPARRRMAGRACVGPHRRRPAALVQQRAPAARDRGGGHQAPRRRPPPRHDPLLGPPAAGDQRVERRRLAGDRRRPTRPPAVGLRPAGGGAGPGRPPPGGAPVRGRGPGRRRGDLGGDGRWAGGGGTGAPTPAPDRTAGLNGGHDADEPRRDRRGSPPRGPSWI